MDVLDEKKLQDLGTALVDKLQTAAQTAGAALISQLEAAGDELIGRLGAQAESLLTAAAQNLQAVESRTVTDLERVLAGLDGWTAEVSVRLSAPKG